MATTPRKGKPWIFVTWLTGILAGKAQCQWAPWYKARFKYDKVVSDFDLAAWSADHDALVQKRLREFEADGWKVRHENENWIRVPGDTAILVGKPDLVASQGGLFVIADGKGGDQSAKDWWQMLTYLWMLPNAWNTPTLRVKGEVFYKTDRVEVFPQELTQVRRQELFGLIRIVGGPTAPDRKPSIPECARCDIADCPDRVSDTEDQSVAMTSEF